MGTFTDATSQIPVDNDWSCAVAFGDVDGDGDLDAFIGNDGQQNRLYLNDGTGVFSDATSQLPGISDNTYVVALGDVDADGDMDVMYQFQTQDTGILCEDTQALLTGSTDANEPLQAVDFITTPACDGGGCHP